MHIFIDESGSFTGYHDRSLSVVGALAIPDGKLDLIKRKYAKIRTRLPVENGEVKGRLLNEQQVSEIVTMLARNEVLFEVTVLDLGFHTEAAVAAHKQGLAEELLARVNRFREPDRQQVEKAAHQILVASLPLYLQAMATLEVLHSILHHVPLYFGQRRPHELGKFAWVVDGKNPTKVTNWEMWWSWYARGALATMSKRRPAPRVEGVDYSFYDRFTATGARQADQDEPNGIDLSLLLADLCFSAVAEPGLELVDIVVNATRRALVGSLGEEGWGGIPRLMVHRREPYIKFVILGEGPDTIQHPPYAKIVNHHFSRGGKLMMAPRFLRDLDKH